MPANVTTIKNQISSYLSELVSASTLGEKQVDDFRIGILDRDFAAYPAAVLTTPQIDSSVYTNTQVYRTHAFEIVVISKGENLASAADIETLMEALLDKFDQNPTLNNTCQELTATVTSPQTVTARSRTFIVFSIVLRAKAIKAP